MALRHKAAHFLGLFWELLPDSFAQKWSLHLLTTFAAFAAEMMKGIEILTAARPPALETVYHQCELLLYSWQVGRVAALGFAI